MSTLQPTDKELRRIRHLAHKAYGYVLSMEEALLVWRMAWIEPWWYKVPRPDDTPASYHACYAGDIRAIARGHKETWSAVA